MPRLIKTSSTKRGDTLIEVMFAITIFALVAVLSISMMNAGIAGGERSLELVTARHELNAQAEALRFIHSSYITELTLPTCDKAAQGEKCQQYTALWEKIAANAMKPAPVDGRAPELDQYNIPSPLDTCDTVYRAADDGISLLVRNHAFVINTRTLNESITGSTDAYVSTIDSKNVLVSDTAADTNPVGINTVFQPADLNARLVYANSTSSTWNYDAGLVTNFSDKNDPRNYTHLAQVDGIWVVAVKGDQTSGSVAGAINGAYYDFYIQTCWYGSNTNAPSSVDTIIRLYTPENTI